MSTFEVYHPTLSSDFCVDDVVAQPRSNPLELGDPGGELPDGVHLAAQELVLQEVTEMGISISHPVGGQETLIHLQCYSVEVKLIYFLVLQFSPVPEPPGKPQEVSPKPCWMVWRGPGRRPFPRACSDTGSGSLPGSSCPPPPGRRTASSSLSKWAAMACSGGKDD